MNETACKKLFVANNSFQNSGIKMFAYFIAKVTVYAEEGKINASLYF